MDKRQQKDKNNLTQQYNIIMYTINKIICSLFLVEVFHTTTETLQLWSEHGYGRWGKLRRAFHCSLHKRTSAHMVA